MNVKKVLYIEGTVNLIMALLKFIVGLTVQSTAIIADAAHSLSDVANNGLAFLAIRFSEKPADDDHPYGHEKFETLAVFALASSLVIIAFEVIIHAVQRIGEPIEPSPVGFWLLVACVVINIGLTTWEHYWAKRLNSHLLHADAKHTLGDVMTSVAVIAGWQLASMGWYWIDAVTAIGVAGIIFYFAFQLFKQSIPILVDGTKLDNAAVGKTVQKLDGIESVHSIRSRYNGKHVAADLIITVAPDMPTEAAHELANEVESILKNKFNVEDAVVHIEPDPQYTADKENPDKKE
ncbi:cation transporter [Paraneptunicella aestuarii]|uniref:cation diffusion facilitator family transporter n=1 Tax=Paraneptunicella aestuarii TaxID=2831148 RepID=UPI001E4B2BE5|nr:cation diffusion facilitator family transporter [Paraneptunicella aestuarii]UAA40592.1 cation transporter [Paraneptunicella aestuarii]